MLFFCLLAPPALAVALLRSLRSKPVSGAGTLVAYGCFTLAVNLSVFAVLTLFFTGGDTALVPALVTTELALKYTLLASAFAVLYAAAAVLAGNAVTPRLLIEPNAHKISPKRSRFVKYAASSLLLGAGVAAYHAALAARELYGNVSLDLLLFHVSVPMDGANTDFVGDLLSRCLPPAFLAVLLSWLLLGNWLRRDVVLALRGERKTWRAVLFPFWRVRRHVLPLSSAAFVILAFLALFRIGLADVFTYLFQSSALIEENYVDPRKITLTFPEQKRNLIYIELESMENTYMTPDVGGAWSVNLIPELTALAREGDSFSNTAGLGGPRSPYGTDWTVAAHVAQTAGLPLLLPVGRNDMISYQNFLPGVRTLGDILQEAGYNQVYMCGSNADFGGREKYFTQHGYNIVDYRSAVRDEIIEPGYNVFWGMEDAKLYKYAQTQLLNLAARDEPFALTVLTVDTHFTDGYFCQLCRNEHGDQYSNVLSCASRQAEAFVRWIMEQDFYENTTVIVTGDHPGMDAAFVAGIGDYMRTTYNVFLNSAARAGRLHGRQFTTMDIFPTTLAALGVQIEGERLGLGVNLYSSEQTLLERLGWETLEAELRKRSGFYNDLLR